MKVGYIQFLSQRMQVTWDEIWFLPASRKPCIRTRCLLAIVSLIWFASILAQRNWYFGDHGWLENSLVRDLISQTQESWRASFAWSPLWYIENELLVVGYLWIGIVLSLVVFTGTGGRYTTAALWVWIVGLSHRLAWTASTAEPVLAAFVGYLIIDPGESFLASRLTKSQTRSWLARFSQRLIQIHCWLLLAAGLASQLANPTWWQADAVWWLAASGRSNTISPEMLRGNILLVNALTHFIVLMELGAIVLLIPKLTRPIGIGLGICVCAAYSLVADQWLYGLLLAVGIVTFFDEKVEELIKMPTVISARQRPG